MAAITLSNSTDAMADVGVQELESHRDIGCVQSVSGSEQCGWIKAEVLYNAKRQLSESYQDLYGSRSAAVKIKEESSSLESMCINSYLHLDSNSHGSVYVEQSFIKSELSDDDLNKTESAAVIGHVYDCKYSTQPLLDSRTLGELLSWDDGTLRRFNIRRAVVRLERMGVEQLQSNKTKWLMKMGSLLMEMGAHCYSKQNQCSHCGKRFQYLKSLRVHIHSHNARKPFTCNQCNKGFTRLHNLRNHGQRKHSVKLESVEAKQHECRLCGKRFQYLKCLNIHIRVHGDLVPFACSQCNKGFTQLDNLRNHEKRMHSVKLDSVMETRQHECCHCGKHFKSKQNLQAHIRTHTGEKPFACEICGKKFSQRHAVLEHAQRMHAERTDVIPCKICGKSFAGSERLGRHLETHTKAFTLPCTECDKKFKSIECLNRHLQRHRGDKRHACSECDKRFCSAGELRRHFVTHRPDVRPFSCAQCDKTFTLRSHLVTHRIQHNSKLSFACMYCEKIFSSKTNLETHIRLHAGYRPYACEQCGKCFSVSHNLSVHKRTHSGERPLCCKQCGRGFAQPSNLKKHELWHNSERPYACEQCDKKYLCASDLRRHLRKHTGVPSHGCGQCGKRFSYAYRLKRHQRLHTGERPFSCTQCEYRCIRKKLLRNHEATHAVVRPYP